MTAKKGFSLVEALISIFLLILLLVFVLDVFPAVQRGLQLSENYVNAALLGHSLLEEVRSLDFDGIIPVSGSKTYTGTRYNRPFSLTMNYQIEVTTLDANRKQVWATVTWPEKTGEKQVIMETIIVQ